MFLTRSIDVLCVCFMLCRTTGEMTFSLIFRIVGCFIVMGGGGGVMTSYFSLQFSLICRTRNKAETFLFRSV